MGGGRGGERDRKEQEGRGKMRNKKERKGKTGCRIV